MADNYLIHFWRTHALRDLQVAMMVGSILISVLGRLSGEELYISLGEGLAWFVILHFFIHSYFYRQYIFLSDHQRSYSMPVKKIKKTGRIYMGCYLMIFCLFTTFLREVYKGTLLAKMKAMLFYLLGLLFGSLIDSGGLGRDELHHRDTGGIIGVMNGVTDHSGSLWDQILNSIQSLLILVGLIFLIALIAFLLVNYVKHLISSISQVEMKKDNVRESLEVEDRIRHRRKGWKEIFDFSSDKKVRSIYKRTIRRLHNRKEPIPEWMTPAQIEAMVKPEGNEVLEQLHVFYEKARYSEKGCSPEEAKIAEALNIH